MSFLSMGRNIARNLLEGPVTRRYPREKREYSPGSRGMILIDIEACTFCNLCARRCPTEALTVRRDLKEWEIDRLRCIFCGRCVEVCPRKCLAMANHYSPGVTAREEAVHLERQADRPKKEEQPKAEE